jgi:hypothetical protein
VRAFSLYASRQHIPRSFTLEHKYWSGYDSYLPSRAPATSRLPHNSQTSSHTFPSNFRITMHFLAVVTAVISFAIFAHAAGVQ